jgi:hypothetical protein
MGEDVRKSMRKNGKKELRVGRERELVWNEINTWSLDKYRGCVEKRRILTWPLLVLPEAGDAHIQVILLHPGHLPHQPLHRKHRQLTNILHVRAN